MMCDPVMVIKPANAQAPAFAFDTHKTRLPHADCIQDARRTAKTVGLHLDTNLDFAIAGGVGDTSVVIICTFIPGGGPCPGQAGAVVSTIVMGQGAADRLKQLKDVFGNAGIIDCG